MLARQSGTRCQMNLEILTTSIVLNGFLKQSSLAATSVTSALEVIFNEMRYINLRFTYFLLLTYFYLVNEISDVSSYIPLVIFTSVFLSLCRR